MSALSDIETVCSITYLSDMMFLPFELNDSDHEFGTIMAYPDLNYFKVYNQYVSNCNYFTESAFNNELYKCHNKKQGFSCAV